jgi:3-carboxy-cis,cis-muconate cycloisomerase
VSDLLWPGDHRAGDLFGDGRFLRALVQVEAAWSDALVDAGIAPPDAALPPGRLEGLIGAADAGPVAEAAEAGGTPVVPLLRLLRERLGPQTPAAAWLHRGLTSQDVVDTALVLCAGEVVAAVGAELARQADRLAGLVRQYRSTPLAARTLTRPAGPTTFGLKAAAWLAGILDAADDLRAVPLPAQIGGAAGTLAAAVELAGARPDAAEAVARAAAGTAARLGLRPAPPWHTVRTAVTRLGDAAVRCTDAWGHLANDVLVLSRPEIGELASGDGVSSTLPHKRNPVLAVLVRRAALAAPPLGQTLHAAAADAVDERTPGGWHAEWATLRTLLRRTVVAGRQCTELLSGLEVRPDRMAAGLAAADGVHAEQEAMAALVGRPPAAAYLGLSDALLDAQLARAAALLERHP